MSTPIKLLRHTTTAAALLLLLGTALSACGGGDEAAAGSSETTEIRYQAFPGQQNYLELAKDLGYLGDLSIKRVGNTISGPQDIQSVATGQADIGGAFNGAIVKLVQAGAPITAVVGYYGADETTYTGYYVLEDSPIRSARDLIGKKVGVNTLGAHHEAVLEIWLREQGLSDEEIEQVELTVIPPVNAEQALRQGQIDVAVLTFALRDRALDGGGLREILSDYDALGPFTAGSLVLRDDFVEKNPGTTRTLVDGIAKAIAWAQDTPREEVVARLQKVAKDNGRPEDAETLGFWKSTGVANKGGAISEQEVSTWVDWLTQTGQIPEGSVRPADVYTNDFNPYAKEAVR
jgi:ABC-type nitrate/sulfonate/bicarbonate transport system substrate-binding protein